VDISTLGLRRSTRPPRQRRERVDDSYNAGMSGRAPRAAHHLLVGIVAWLLVSGTAQVGQLQTVGLASRIEQLSEPGGFFDTDNLISNERSYLQVVPALREAGLAGGAYIGVGPDQNFSYIAQIRPSMAFIIDIRRDNLLLHLLFKALFQLSQTRVDYLSLLFGRPVPPRLDDWRGANLDRLLTYIDGTRPSPPATTALRTRVDATIKRFAVPLSAADLRTIDRFHRAFISAGLLLKFETTGRGPRDYYPTYRELLLETDRQGRQWNFLASESDFQFVRSLERQDLVVPVVGDLSGPKAVVAIGGLMAQRGDRLSAFYTSNVEFYLSGDKFSKFIDNLSHLPHTDRSLMIRSVFGAGGSGPPPQSMPGYASASIVQSVDELLQGYPSGRFRNYFELTNPH
jgi:hypothetical protein